MSKTTKPLVLVTWDDAWGKTEETVTNDTVDQLHKPLVIHTLGWLLRDDAKGISLANEYYADEQTFRGYTFIPRAMVQTVELFTLSKPRKPKAAKAGIPAPLHTPSESQTSQ